MKNLKGLIPFIIFGVAVFTIFFDSNENENDAPSTSRDIDSYGAQGVLASWPPMDESASAIASEIIASNYYLVLDGSGSMGDEGCSNGRKKIDVAKDALKSFTNKIASSSNIGIFAFDSRGLGERLTLGNYPAEKVHNELDRITAGGGTPLSTAVKAANIALTKQAKKQLGYGEYHLVIVTDGEANGGYEPDSEVKALLEESPIVVHTVGFCINDRHSLNNPGYTIYKSANDPESLMAGLDAVLAEAPDFSVSDFSSSAP